MATKKTDDKTTEAKATDSQETSNTTQAQQATGGQGVRRGLGAPPPGTEGDPTVKAVDPGEGETTQK